VTTTSNGTRPHLNAVPHPDEPPPEDGIDTRPPPNDVPAEQAVLGAMMLSRQAILDALEVLQPHDFYRPPHEWIWDAIITMHTAGDPVDAVTVSDHLTSTGQLAKIGGAPYLHTLISTVPVAANAGHYARIVADRAANRRLVEAGTRIAQLGYATNGGNVADLQHAATQTLERATTGQPTGGGTASTWQPVDLTPFLYGEQIATVAPSLLARSDGAHLIYPGAVHSISGEPGSGKSWVAVLACLQEITEAHPVAYLDFEDRAARVTSRLLEAGGHPAQIEAHFRYLRPETALTAGTVAHLVAAVQGCSLVVIDGITEAMGMHGLSLLDNEDVARFIALLPRRIANLGPAVLQIDHVVKNSEARGRWAIGGQHKLAAIDGCAFKAEIVEKFGRGKRGQTRIVLDKDREGHVEEIATGGAVATLTLDSTPDERHDAGQLRMYLDPPAPEPADEDGGFRPTHLMARVSRYVEINPAATGKQIEEVVSGKAQYVRQAIRSLVQEGHLRVETGPRGARLYYSTGRYTDTPEP
jgi:hypothetical protein